jgi:hypothetical protein
MDDVKTIELNGRTIEIYKFGAIEGWKLGHKLISIVGPSLGHLADDKYADAFSELFKNCNENEFIQLLRKLMSIVRIDGIECNDSHLKDHMLCVGVMKEVFLHNFGDFFSAIQSVIPEKPGT